MYANFGDPRSRDRELRYKKNIKNGDFWLSKVLICLHLACTAEICTHVGNYDRFMQTEFGGTRLPDQNVTGRKWAQSGLV